VAGGPDKDYPGAERKRFGDDWSLIRGCAMERKIFDIGGHAHFVTFSCYKRRRVLDDHRAKGIVIHFLADQLRRAEGACLGFVIMPDHVHGLVHFKEATMLSQFMQQWKRRSSIRRVARMCAGRTDGWWVARIRIIRARSARGLAMTGP
jgi:REP element-mobilizing transposase RayT